MTVDLPPSRDDVVAQLAGLAPDGDVAALRAARAEAKRYTQGSDDALFAPDATDLALDERLAAAAYAAHLSASGVAAQASRERLRALGDERAKAADALLARIEAGASISEAGANTRLAAILAHTRALIDAPAATNQAALHALQHAGLSTRAIVALSQLVAFVSYQIRVVAALRALEERA